MKNILIAGVLLLNTSIASAAINLYTFTGTVTGAGESIDGISTYNSNDLATGSSNGWANALTGDTVSYTVAIDFAAPATINFDPSLYTWTDTATVDYFYVALVSDLNNVSLINGCLDTNNDYNNGQQLSNGIVGMQLGNSSQYMQINVGDGVNSNNFALGAVWQGNEQSFGSYNEMNASAAVVSNLTLTSISSVSPVPEPSTLLLFGAGLGFLAYRRKKVVVTA